MRIWVDADACPGAIKEIIIRAAMKRLVLTVFVANKEIHLPVSPYLSAIRVPLGADVVDQYIVQEAKINELVISQDIPLAAQLVSAGINVISPYGVLFTDSNIAAKLAMRNFSQELRDMGHNTGGPKPLGEKEKRQFSNMFDQVLTRLQSN
jgi:uncharacterized protein